MVCDPDVGECLIDFMEDVVEDFVYIILEEVEGIYHEF